MQENDNRQVEGVSILLLIFLRLQGFSTDKKKRKEERIIVLKFFSLWLYV